MFWISDSDSDVSAERSEGMRWAEGALFFVYFISIFPDASVTRLD